MRQSRILRALAGLLIAGLFVFFAFRGISFSSLLHDALRANYLILTIATLVVLFSHFLRALRWRVILQEVKGDISLVDTWGSIMVGYLVNNFIPRLGEIVRAYTTGRMEKISVSSVIGTIVLERLFDMLSAGILFGLALFMYHGDLTASFPFLRIAGIILVAGSIILGGILYTASISEKVQNILLKIVESILPRKIAHKAESIILSFLESFKILRSGKRLGLIAFYTALIWIAYIYSTNRTLRGNDRLTISQPPLGFRAISKASISNGCRRVFSCFITLNSGKLPSEPPRRKRRGIVSCPSAFVGHPYIDSRQKHAGMTTPQAAGNGSPHQFNSANLAPNLPDLPFNSANFIFWQGNRRFWRGNQAFNSGNLALNLPDLPLTLTNLSFHKTNVSLRALEEPLR